jgi:hypothetical protein
MDSSLVRDVLYRHKPRSWSSTTPHEEVLKELPTNSREFISAKDKIRWSERPLFVDVTQVFRVENPYLYGEYNTEVSSNLLKTMH